MHRLVVVATALGLAACGGDDTEPIENGQPAGWDDELRHFDPVQNPAQLNAAVFDKAFGDLMVLLDQLLEPREDAGS